MLAATTTNPHVGTTHTQNPTTHASHKMGTHSYRKVVESNQLQFPTDTPTLTTSKKSKHLTIAPSGCSDAADVLALRMVADLGPALERFMEACCGS